MKKLLKNKVVMIAAAVVVIIVVLIIAISCSAKGKKVKEIDTENEALELSDENWATKGGRKKYDAKGYESLTGIDVSEHVGDIDWARVKDDGIDFAILRVGYRGYETGGFVFDNKLRTYLDGCNKENIPVGVYFVSQAINPEEAVEEVEKVLLEIKGFEISMPIYIDLENAGDTARTKNLTVEQYTEIVDAFCTRVEEEGYRAGIYSNENWIRAHLEWDELSKWDLWFAKYTDVPATDLPFTMWQYSESAMIDGASGACDLNVRVYKK